MREHRPDLRVLFISGYDPGAELTDPPADPRTSFLGKPFTHRELGRRIREMLA
jgi:hypothetical protein